MTDDQTLTQYATPFVGESQQLLQAAQNSRVLNDADFETAGQYLLRVTARRKALKQTIDFFTKPLEEHIARVKSFFAPASEALSATEAHVRAEMNRFQTEVSRQRAALRAQAEQQAGGGQVGAFAATMVVAQQPRPQAAGVGLTTRYKARVVNVALVPEEFKLVDEKKLNALARSSKGTAQVPGVEFYTEQSVVARG